MSKSSVKQFGKLAGYAIIPITIVVAIGLIAVRRFDWYILVGLAVLLLAVAIFAATNPEVWQRSMGRQRVSSTISGIVVVVALVGVMVLLNVLISRAAVQFDLTKNKNFTISDTSVKVVQKFTTPVTAIIFYDRQSQDQQQRAVDLLKQYQTQSDKLTYQPVNASVDFVTAQAYNLQSLPSVVFEYNKRREIVTSVDEQSFTRAMLKIQNPTLRRVLVTTGHGEAATQFNQQTGNSLAAAIQALTENNYDVKIYNSVTGTASAAAPAAGATAPPAAPAPENVELNPYNDILLIAGPRGQFQDAEKKRITTFLRQGGKALIAYDISGNADPNVQATNLNDLLADWKVKFNRGLVIETDRARRSSDNPSVLIPELVSGSAITSGLDNQLVVAPVSVSITKDADATATFGDALRSSANSFLKVKVPPTSAEFEQGDVRGPITVVATIEDKPKEAAPPRPAVTAPSTTPGAAPAPAPAADTTQPLNTRIVLMGSTLVFNDQVLSQFVGNFNFFVKAMNYLNESADSVVIGSKTADSKPFNYNDGQASLTFWASFLGLPILIMFLGLVAWWRRR